jgi:CheY-like chemotaxis protein
MLNLLGNAVKFTERGEINLRVRREAADATGATLQFSVEDTGIGISADKQARVFDPFTQADGSIARSFGGTGLGLTISRQLVQMMGGRIWVDTELGRGSTFHFTARFGVSAEKENPEPSEEVQLNDLLVLVVDDNGTNRQILGELLSHWGMKPTLAGDGGEALRLLKEAIAAGEPFRLVLVDVSMSGMSGFELAGEIRNNPRLSGAAIIMLTSAGQRGDAARCRELGLEGYITKPVGQSELLNAIKRVRGSVRSGATPALVTRHSMRESGGNSRILLAEDNLVNQRLASRLLEKQGHRVVTVGSGREALERLERENFDLILMDVQMPEVDGIEATLTIRTKEVSTGAHIPIVAMTANAMQGDKDRCLAAGMDGFISKPINARELLAVVQTLGCQGR